MSNSSNRSNMSMIDYLNDTSYVYDARRLEVPIWFIFNAFDAFQDKL